MDWSLKAVLAASMLQVAMFSMGQAQFPDYGMECLEWDNVTATLNRNSDMQLSCSPDGQCTGFDCSGSYGYQGYLSTSLFLLKFCYGIRLLQCQNPVGLFFYLSFPDNHDEFNDTVHNSTQLQIPGLSYDLKLGKADGFVVVDMEPVTLGFHKFIRLGLNFKMRVRLMGTSYETWPRSLQHSLMPDTIVRVPPCYRDQKNNPVAPPLNKCNVNFTTPSPGVGTTPALPRNYTVTGSTPTWQTTSMNPSDRGKSCNANEFGSCGHKEKCVDGWCQCLSDTYRNDLGNCIDRVQQNITDIIIDEPFDNPGSNSSPSGPNKNTITIVISTVVAVVIGAGFLSLFIVLFIRYKRHKARYGQHELLNNSDDDPLEIAT